MDERGGAAYAYVFPCGIARSVVVIYCRCQDSWVKSAIGIYTEPYHVGGGGADLSLHGSSRAAVKGRGRMERRRRKRRTESARA